MTNDAEQTAQSAEKSTSNDPGYCLQWSRERAAIGSKYPDATTAWKNTKAQRHPGDTNPPRGAMCYWTGGSKGYGHIAVSLGGGKIRSSDAGGSGRPATVDLTWPATYWGLPYAGWADNVNDVNIPGVSSGDDNNGEDDEMPQYDHASTSKTQKIKANEWVGIVWTNVPAGPAIKPGDKLAALGGRKYSAALHATFEAPKGSTIRLRAVEVESSSTAETNPQTEFLATSGSSFAEYVHNGGVQKGRSLAFRVSCSQDATMTAADLVVLSWG